MTKPLIAVNLLLTAFVLALPILSRGLDPFDDAYITYRYSHNLAEGRGFVYNPGAHVLGTTTPLYTLLIAATAYVGSLSSEGLIQASYAWNAVLAAGALWLLSLLLQDLAGKPWLTIACCLGYACRIAPLAVLGGMEIPLLLVCCLGAYYLTVCRAQSVAGGALAGMALLTRPDAALFVVLVFAAALLVSRRSGLLFGVAVAVVVLLWILWASWYFGSAVPNSIAAKVIVNTVGPTDTANQLGTRLLDLLGLPIKDRALPVLAALYALGVVGLWPGRVKALPLLLYPALFCAAFVGRGQFIFPWYTALMELSMITVAFAGMASLGAVAPRMRIPAAALAVALLINLLAPGPLLIPNLANGPRNRSFPRALRAAAEGVTAAWQDESRRPVIVAPEIGAIGYYTNAHVIDSVGLVSPEVFPLLRKGAPAGGGVTVEAARQFQPDYVVFRRELLSFAPQPWEALHRGYVLVASYPCHQGPVEVYAKRNGQPEASSA